MKKFEEIKKDVKEHKKEVIIFGAGGVALLGLGILIGKKVFAPASVMNLAQEVGDFTATAKPIIPEGAIDKATNIYRTIDDELFTEITPVIEETLLSNSVDTLHIERSWDIEPNVVKNLVVDVTTVVKD